MNQTLLEQRTPSPWQGEGGGEGSAFLPAFETWLAEAGRSRNTITAYRRCLQVFTRWFAAANRQPFTLDLLNSYDLRAFRQWSLAVQGVKPATWNLRRAALMALSTYARAGGFIESDPLRGVLPANQQPLPPRWLERDQFARLMRQLEINVNAANTPARRQRALRDAALVGVMAFAGLRESEAAALTLEDVQLSPRSGSVVVRHGKGGSRRSIPLSSEARRILSAWLDVRPRSGCVRPAAGNHLFIDESGDALSTRAIQKRIRALGAAAAVEGLTPHRLRHTCAKRMVDAGRQLTEVRQVLGHAKIETTCRYAQAGWEDLEAAVESVHLGAMAQA